MKLFCLLLISQSGMKAKPFKILFLEDDEQDVELMQYVLHEAKLDHVSKRVDTKKDFILSLSAFEPDIILADYSMPTFNGMHAFRLFKDQHIFIPFVLVTGALSEELAIECVKEGIDDFILKSSYKRLPQVIIRNLEIKKAELQRVKITSDLNKKIEELKLLKEKNESAKSHELLSNREFEIMCLIASGKSIKDIAEQLFLSPATITTYRVRLLEKLCLTSNVDLTRYVIENKLS